MSSSEDKELVIGTIACMLEKNRAETIKEILTTWCKWCGTDRGVDGSQTCRCCEICGTKRGSSSWVQTCGCLDT